MSHQFPAAAATSCSLWSDVCQMMPPFIASHLDYCNALFFGITNELFCCLQSAQNAAARLVTGAKRSDYISPVFHQLHWLPVLQRVVFKIENCTGTRIAGFPRGPRGTRGYGDKVHGLTAGMGPITRGHRGDGFNNLWGHRGHGVCA